MSPTDKVKVQMKYPPLNNDKESDIKSVSLLLMLYTNHFIAYSNDEQDLN
jgi:hypothetical protein